MPRVPPHQTSPFEPVRGRAGSSQELILPKPIAGNPRTTRGPPADRFDLEPLLVRPRQAMKLLGCGADRLWALIKLGEIESFLDGTARRISLGSIKAYVARQLAAPPTSRDRVRRRAPVSSDPQASARGGTTT
jgi:hypothetical protein